MSTFLSRNPQFGEGIRPQNLVLFLGKQKKAAHILTKNVLYRLSYVGTGFRIPVSLFYRIGTLAARIRSGAFGSLPLLSRETILTD